MRLKSRDRQKAHPRPPRNVHIKFQIPSTIWRGAIRRKNSKKKKIKQHRIGKERKKNRAEKKKNPKDQTIRLALNF